MITTDQEPPLNNKARTIVEWMDDWEFVPDYPHDLINNAGIRINPNSDEEQVEIISSLWTSLDILREVLNEIQKDHLEATYEKVINKMYDEACRRDLGSQGMHINFEWDYKINPKPKLQLIIIYRTLKEAGEIQE